MMKFAAVAEHIHPIATATPLKVLFKGIVAE
jgi:hypothetical protein